MLRYSTQQTTNTFQLLNDGISVLLMVQKSQTTTWDVKTPLAKNTNLKWLAVSWIFCINNIAFYKLYIVTTEMFPLPRFVVFLFHENFPPLNGCFWFP